MIGVTAADDQRAVGFATEVVSDACELDGGVDGFGARVDEKHPGVGHRSEFRELGGEAFCGLVRVSLEGVERLEHLQLCGDRVDHLWLRVTDVAVPQ
ncbi:MAG: hypothetical protein M5U31_01420 [Acidimicrobiia bacterium]|nr:hypothetical protein [Acidimicrobiia bacterium]